MIWLARQDERAGARISAVLEGLALQQASGALEIDGDPTGVVYLDQGFITLALASWIPDVASRLRAALPAAGEVPGLLGSGERAGPDPGTALVRRGLITKGGLQAILRSVTVDAIVALTVPPLCETSVRGTRFVPLRMHWAGNFSRLSVASVRAEAVMRAGRMARCNLAPGVPVTLCDLTGASAVIRREQWAIIGRIGPARSARELAQRCGLALYDTVERIGDLIETGMCAPCPAGTLPPGDGREPAPPSTLTPPQATAGLAAAGPGRAPEPPAGGEPGPLPAAPHRPGTPESLPRRPAAPGEAEGPEPPAPPPDLLLRVLEGLRRLSLWRARPATARRAARAKVLSAGRRAPHRKDAGIVLAAVPAPRSPLCLRGGRPL